MPVCWTTVVFVVVMASYQPKVCGAWWMRLGGPQQNQPTMTNQGPILSYLTLSLTLPCLPSTYQPLLIIITYHDRSYLTFSAVPLWQVRPSSRNKSRSRPENSKRASINKVSEGRTGKGGHGRRRRRLCTPILLPFYHIHLSHI